MKYFNIIAVMLFVGLVSCNNPVEKYDFNTSEYSTVYSVQARNYPVRVQMEMGSDTTIYISANFGGIDYPANDITVKFAPDVSLVDNYNQDNQTSYSVLDAGAYSFPVTDAVIPKGKLESGLLALNIDSDGFAGVGPFVLPISIKSVSSDIPVNQEMKDIYIEVQGVYSTDPVVDYFDRLNWDITGYSTYNSEPYRPALMFDDDVKTFWHTNWAGGTTPPPHWFSVDMKSGQTISGLEITGRPASDTNLVTPYSRGIPSYIIFQVSDDGNEWETLGSFTMPDPVGKMKNRIYLSDKVTARHFKLTSLSQTGGYAGCNISEFNLF